MIDNVLQINQLVEISINDTNGNRKIYRSRVEGKDKDFIDLASPIKDGVVIPIREGEIVNISYIDSTATYSFDSIIVSRYNKELPVIRVKKPTEVKRTQRRNFVRFDTKLKVSFNIVRNEIADYEQTYSGQTVDISGGGIMLATTATINKEDIVDLIINIPNIGNISAMGKVVRVMEKNIQGHEILLLGIDFIVIEERDRDKIVRFIFEKQREMRQRGLL